MKRIIAGLATVTASVLFAAPTEAFTHRFSGNCPSNIVAAFQDYLGAMRRGDYIRPTVGRDLMSLRGRVFPISDLIPNNPSSRWSASNDAVSFELSDGTTVLMHTTYIGNQTHITQQNVTMNGCTASITE